MYAEQDCLPLSGLQHFSFCERRWALVFLESLWEDNVFTAEGNLLHETAHSGDVESRPGVLIRRTLPLHSLRLGLSGMADIIEFHPVPAEQGIVLPKHHGFWQPYPIEYKRSRDKAGSRAYRIQLCAQALCLEEMLHTSVPQGAVFDGKAHRRQLVDFDSVLRAEVEQVAARMHELRLQCLTPPAEYAKRCDSCSLVQLCLPKTLHFNAASRYLRSSVRAALSAKVS